MPLTNADLERILLGEAKKLDNRIVIGGLESFVETWALEQNTAGDAGRALHVDTIVNCLKGYSDAGEATRRRMISQALELARSQTLPAATVHHKNSKRPQPRSRPAETPAPQIAEQQLEQDEPLPKLTLRDSRPFGLDAPVTRLQSVGPAYARKLARLNIWTVQDLLYHFPHRYDDYSDLKTVSQLVYGDEVTLLLTVSNVSIRRSQRGMTITTVTFAAPTGTIKAVFFNQPFLQNQLRSGRRVFVSGRVDRDLNRLSFKHPDWEPLSREMLHTARIVPVYPLTEGLSNRWLRRLIHSVVEYWAPRVPDPLPSDIRRREHLDDISTALNEVHFPTSFEHMQTARRRLAFEEFLYIQLGVLKQRQKWRSVPTRPLSVTNTRVQEFIASLPFRLTSAQERSIDEILRDIQQSHPMSRLLQGDVGSGKTVVAAVAMDAAVANGAQAAVLAPTEILAEQHFRTLADLFKNRARIALLTGSLKSREKQGVRAELAAGEIKIAVGTHALIQESVKFKDLALAVIDEQHRFGVEQRGTIRSKGYNPHVLVMSATPIPRTLALTVYGDLDLSIINEMPPGRQSIKTKWLEPKERERAYSFIRKEVLEGRQAFVICPLIEESESIDAKAAVEEYERLRKTIFPDLHVGLIHGKLKSADKEAVMNGFRDRAIDILVATSVVEVGIDIPNATVMLIEGADRFGLAQLHQFRGRVGRGEHQSFCLLLADKSGATSDERLKVIESSQDGFRLAEEDLKLRGPGEFFGTRQSGLPDLKIAKLSDVRYLEQARAVAQYLFDRDPELKHPEHDLLAQRVDEFWRGKGDLS